ncbi:hypothetical protein B9Z55_002886 [Caenorhabditis nigoni]|uniref:Uncharacterized protein n=1 Tax=Caenorhabditis nigoni TaxID=1611254 RepID=A0A2G5VMH0_9PELO|nr:hypothetical protein B9Z55_029022 [Caenorhabditis nigoni]PIC53015.1 hypothetical protein B9Z55_002886 [Caenorhabditis nigoni]
MVKLALKRLKIAKKWPEESNFNLLKDNGIEDITQMMEHVCEVFRSPICEMHITEESLIEWIIKFQPIIRYVCVCMDVLTSVESLDRILKKSSFLMTGLMVAQFMVGKRFLSRRFGIQPSSGEGFNHLKKERS